MTPYELRNHIRGGLPVFGTLIVSPSPKWPEVVADCDLDFISLTLSISRLIDLS